MNHIRLSGVSILYGHLLLATISALLPPASLLRQKVSKGYMKKLSLLLAIMSVIVTGCIVVPMGYDGGYYGHHHEHGYSDRGDYDDSHRGWGGHGR